MVFEKLDEANILGHGGNLNNELEKSPKNKIELEEGEIIIVWRAKKVENDSEHPQIIEYRGEVEKEIVEVVESINILELIPAIGFIIERNNEKNTGYIDPRTGEQVVHITASAIEKYMGQERTRRQKHFGERFQNLVHHELIHLLDDFTENNLEIRNKHAEKVRELREKQLEELEKVGNRINTQKAVAIAEIEEMLNLSLHLIRAEGLTKVYDGSLEEQFKSEKGKFNDNDIEDLDERLYNDAKSHANQIRQGLREDKSLNTLSHLEELYRTEDPEVIEGKKDTLIGFLTGDLMYQIAKHVVFTLTRFKTEDPFKPKMPIEEISEKGPIQIINEYEEIMFKRGKEPVITVNSGEGVIDYKEIKDSLIKEFEKVVDIK